MPKEFNIPGLKDAISEFETLRNHAAGLAKDLLDGAIAADKIMKAFGGSQSLKDYIELQKKANEEKKKTIEVADKLAVAEKKLADAQSDIGKKIAEVNVQIINQNKLNKQAAIEVLGLDSAYTKLNKRRADAKNILRDLIASETASNAEIRKAQREFDVLDEKVRKADAAVKDFHKNVANYPQMFSAVGSGLKNLIGAFGVTGGIAAFAGIMKGAYETSKKFEQAVADLSSITGASGKDLDYLKQKAIDLGKGVQGGAVAVVEAYKLIASAKPELLENVQALNQVTEATIILAQAAGMELPAAATALTDAMNQFGVDASKATEFVDALANGAKYGSAEIPQITEALLKFGAVARSSNIDIKESTALIELLAENGIKGADAGTALRNVLLKISAPDALPRAAQAAIKGLGIDFAMLKDKATPIQEKFEALKPLLADNSKLLKAFGFENIVAAQNIIEHTDRLAELTSKMGEVGTAEEQAAIRMDTVQGKTEKLSSTYDSLVLSINSGSGAVSNFFKFFIDGATDALNSLIRLNTGWDVLFNKAKEDGTSSGAKSFQRQFNNLAGTGSDADISASIKTVAKKNLDMYQAAYSENEKQMKEWQETGFFGKYVWGEGSTKEKAMKAEKERLIKAIAEQASIISQAKGKIEAKPGTETPDIATGPVVPGMSEEEIKKALAAQKKLEEIQRKTAENAIKTMKITLDNLMQGYDQQEHLDSENIAHIQAVSELKIAIANAEMNKSLIGVKKGSADEQSIVKANAQEIEKINKERSVALTKITVDRAAFELTLFELNNQTLLDGTRELTDLLIEEEKRRLNETLAIQKEKMRLELAIDRELTDEKLKEMARSEEGRKLLTANQIKYIQFIYKAEEATNKQIVKNNDDLLKVKLKMIDDEENANIRKYNLLQKGSAKNQEYEFKQIDQKLKKEKKAYEDDQKRYKNDTKAYADNAKKIDDIELQLAENKQKYNSIVSESKRAATLQGLELLIEIAGKESAVGKAAAIAQATINTYVGASRALKDFPYPFGGIVAGLVVAQGLMTVSKILGVKGFAKGTKNAPYTGVAMVDEEGAEIHTDQYGRIKSMGSDGGAHLTNITKGDKIIPADISSVIKQTMFSNYKIKGDQANIIDYDKIGDQFGTHADKIVKAVRSRKSSSIHVHVNKSSEAEVSLKGKKV